MPHFSAISKLFFGLVLLSFSCSEHNSAKIPSGNTWFDSTAYPGQPFYSVTLFTLDTLKSMTNVSDSGTFVDKSIAEYVGKAGYSFVNKAGIPKTKDFTSYELNALQIKRLQSFLKKQPCSDSLAVLSNSCAPEFRDVFIFYNAAKSPIAQVHICLQSK